MGAAPTFSRGRIIMAIFSKHSNILRAIAAISSAIAAITLAAGGRHYVERYAVRGQSKRDRRQLAAINSVISNAAAGDTVYFPAGVYDIGGAINAKAGVTILGAGASSVVIRDIQGSGSVGGMPMVNFSNVSNVAISGMTLDGHNNVYAGTGISVSGGSGENINNLCIQNLSRPAIARESSSVQTSRIR